MNLLLTDGGTPFEALMTLFNYKLMSYKLIIKFLKFTDAEISSDVITIKSSQL